MCTWLTALIPSRLALCNAHHMCLYYLLTNITYYTFIGMPDREWPPGSFPCPSDSTYVSLFFIPVNMTSIIEAVFASQVF